MKNQFKIFLSAACTLLISVFWGCEKQDSFANSLAKNTQIEFKEISKKDHRWYYFTKDNFERVNLPQHAPQAILKPWTEAVRVSSSISIGNESFMTVNKLGILNCEPENENQAVINTDNAFFSDLTADNLVSIDGYPVFHVYKNQEFNNKKNQQVNHPFLVQFHPDTNVFVPLLSTQDLNSEYSDDVEVSDLIYKDNEWSATLKSVDNNKKKFDYITFSTLEELTSIEPSQRKDAVVAERIGEGEFRAKMTPEDMSKSPQRVQELMSRLPKDFSYFIQLSSQNSGQQKSFIQATDISDPEIMESQVLLGDTFSIAIFTDGTGFFSGALQDRYIVNNGNPIAFRLPKLPKNFTYSSLIVEGDILYIGWEESIFYETGRSGFLTVNLGSVFYDTEA